MQHNPVVELNLDGITASPVTFDWKISKFDLSFYLNDDGNGLHGMLEYNTDLFNPSTIERLAGHYEVLLKSIATDPNRHISDLPLLTEGERHQLLEAFNATMVDYPGIGVCMH